MFSYRWASERESITLCLEEVRQVAVPVGRQTTTESGRVYQNAASGQSLPSTTNLCVGWDVKPQSPNQLDQLIHGTRTRGFWL